MVCDSWKPMLTDELPSVLLDVEQVARVTRVRVPMSGGNDRSSTELSGLFIRQIVRVAL
jgi:hypothetical protein